MTPTSSSNSPAEAASSEPSQKAGRAARFLRACGRYPFPALAATLLLTLVLLDIPIVPSSTEVDLSLGDVLSFAHKHRLQFGPDITSTYGPLGWLYFPYYAPHSGTRRLVTDFALTFVTLAGCCLAAWRLKLLWRILLLAIFTWGAANVFFRGDLLINAGLLCWGLLCVVETGRRLAAAIAGFVVLAVYASLAKVSYLFIGAASVGMIGCDLLLRGQRKQAVGLLIAFATGFLGLWVVAGQSLLNLGVFLHHAVTSAQSYNQALGIEGLIVLRQYAFVLGLILLLVLVARCTVAFEGNCWSVRFRRGLILVWLGFSSLTIWKHGFTRLDTFHAPLFLNFVLLLAFVCDVLPTNARGVRIGTNVLGAVCVLGSVALLQMFFFLPAPQCLTQPLRELRMHTDDVFHPIQYQLSLERPRAETNMDYQLPRSREIIGKASVDVFGQYQAFALDNGLNYRPRPVFQSYNACNRALMALNEASYLTGDPPQFVLFDLKAMDDKFPPLEDAWLLRHLLINYKPIAQENRFILLQAKSAQRCRLTLLQQDFVPFGQKINLRKFGRGPFWLELELTPTLRGSLRQLLYASPVVRLAAWNEAGKTIIRRRAPSSMLSAGFLASPLILRTLDVQTLFDDPENAWRPAAYSVEAAPGQQSLWQNAVRFRLYQIENPIGPIRSDAANDK